MQYCCLKCVFRRVFDILVAAFLAQKIADETQNRPDFKLTVCGQSNVLKMTQLRN